MAKKKNKTRVDWKKVSIIAVVTLCLIIIICIITFDSRDGLVGKAYGKATNLSLSSNFISVDSCLKSGDENSSYFIKGTLTYVKSDNSTKKLSKSYGPYSDTCSGNKLTEYVCSNGNKVKRQLVICNYGCENGACKQKEKPKPFCKDSDGINLSQKGSVTGMLPNTDEAVTIEESCSSNTQVTEYFCNGNYINALNQYFINGELSADSVFCPKDTFCKDGACIVETCENWIYPGKNSICESNVLIDCGSGNKTDCSAQHGYLGPEVCGQKGIGFAHECLEPCSPGQELFICYKNLLNQKVPQHYAKLTCGEYDYGGFDWILEDVQSCPSGKICSNSWGQTIGDAGFFEYAFCKEI